MKIWVDATNPPQILLYRGIVQVLEEQGRCPVITVRAFDKTLSLAKMYGLRATAIGMHGGCSKLGKVWRTVQRALKLALFVRREDVSLAIGSSHSQAITASLLRMPFVFQMDYEHQPASQLSARLATRILVPKYLPDSALAKYGTRAMHRVRKYDGLKEELYLFDFVPDPRFHEKLVIPWDDRVIIVVRPPSVVAAYRRDDEGLFEALLEYLASRPHVHVVVSPRAGNSLPSWIERQANFTILDKPVDGPNLIYAADLVISGGGTMNREAVVLGTPACTVFRGELGAVDRHSIQEGKMIQVADKQDFASIQLRKKQPGAPLNLRRSVVEQFVSLALGCPSSIDNVLTGLD